MQLRATWTGHSSVDAAGNVVDLLEAAPRVNGDLSRPPQVLKCRLVRRPLPPATPRLASRAHPVVNVANAHRTGLPEQIHRLLHPLRPTAAKSLPHPCIVQVASPTRLEPIGPPRQPIGPYQAGIVRPVFEDGSMPLGLHRQLDWLVSIEPRVQDQVVGTLDERDAVDLDIAQCPDHGEHPRVGGSRRGCRKRASGQEQQPRFGHPDSWGVGMRIRHVVKLPIRSTSRGSCETGAPNGSG